MTREQPVPTRIEPQDPAEEDGGEHRPPNRRGGDVASADMVEGAGQPEQGERLLLPIGHYVGGHYQDGKPNIPRQVRRGATFHELTDEQFAVWTGAHGTPDAVENGVTWQRRSVEEQVAGAGGLIDELLEIGLLVEVAPGGDQALEFARSHRLVPLMLGLGNSPDEADMFDIGFLQQPVLSVSHPIYDLWQWSTVDDLVWVTCENSADVAQRSGYTNPEYLDPTRLLTGLLGSLHALLVAHAAYLDIGFRLDWPQATVAGTISVGGGDDNG